MSRHCSRMEGVRLDHDAKHIATETDVVVGFNIQQERRNH
jgi:hypothetical protein